MSMEANKIKRQTWNTSYILDIPTIDKQHMQFFKLFDKFNMLDPQNLDYETIKVYIDELEKYTKLHFRTEESLLRISNYDDLILHVEQHHIFSNKIDEFKIAYGYGNHLILTQIITFMRKWLIVHISEVDRKYALSVKQFLIDRNFTDELILKNATESIIE